MPRRTLPRRLPEPLPRTEPRAAKGKLPRSGRKRAERVPMLARRRKKRQKESEKGAQASRGAAHAPRSRQSRA
eukprot:9394870-Alexandrium_andersonii.AAC.1